MNDPYPDVQERAAYSRLVTGLGEWIIEAFEGPHCEIIALEGYCLTCEDPIMQSVKRIVSFMVRAQVRRELG